MKKIGSGNMQTNKAIIYNFFAKNEEQLHQRYTTNEVAEHVGLQRTNVSSLLNELVAEERLQKTTTRPVYYSLTKPIDTLQRQAFTNLIGFDLSLKPLLFETIGALLYPKEFFHVIIEGARGTGKSALADAISQFSLDNDLITDKSFFRLSLKDEVIIDEEALTAYFFDSAHPGNFFAKTHKGMLVIDDMHLLSTKLQEKIFLTI